jgi:hypothetical protein
MRFLLALAVLLTLGTSAAQAQDWTLDPTYGNVNLERGFLPDPHAVELTAGGSVDVNVGGCTYGHVANAPDVDFYYDTDGGADLYIYAVSGSDTTVLVNTPSGTWLCDDDGYGDGDPIVVISKAESGLYNIWVGTYGDEMASANLYISEVDPR